MILECVPHPYELCINPSLVYRSQCPLCEKDLLLQMYKNSYNYSNHFLTMNLVTNLHVYSKQLTYIRITRSCTYTHKFAVSGGVTLHHEKIYTEDMVRSAPG